jgi:hypothetical protein
VILFAQRVFQAAGAWGMLVCLLGYGVFLTGYDPSFDALARPEFVHGFFIVVFAWQVAFLFIATDPVRYRPLMLAAMIEKFPFTLAVLLLYGRGDVDGTMLGLGLIDGVLGALFWAAYVATGRVAGE